MKQTANQKILRMVQLSMLIALVLVLQLTAGFMSIGTLTFSFVLVPIVIGAILFGAKGGAFLGFVWGAVVAYMGAMGWLGALVTLMWTQNPICMILVCVVKGILAGLCPALVYGGLSKTKLPPLAGTMIAAVVAPIVNTGVFLVGMFTVFGEILQTFAVSAGFANVMVAAVVGLVGINFVVEFSINLILGPTILRIINLIKSKKLVK